MKVKKCPYCGKRVGYASNYSSRRKGEFVCERCGKESRVFVSKKIYFAFAFAVVISLAIMAGWIFAGYLSNPLGILLVAAPLVLFTFFTPKFVSYEPLKKYKKSMEAKKAGIVYSDNLVTSEFEEKDTTAFAPAVSTTESIAGTTGSFNINSDVFNKIRAERNAAREQLQSDNLISDSAKIETEKSERFVPIINNVSENHASTEAPLRKIHSEAPQKINRKQHYIPIESDSHENDNKKHAAHRYSSNRKF